MNKFREFFLIFTDLMHILLMITGLHFVPNCF